MSAGLHFRIYLDQDFVFVFWGQNGGGGGGGEGGWGISIQAMRMRLGGEEIGRFSIAFKANGKRQAEIFSLMKSNEAFLV